MAIPFFTLYLLYAALSPYLPLLIRGLGYSPTVVGVLLGIFEGAGILGPFIFGYFADKLGRYKAGLIITNGLVFITIIPLVICIHPVISALLLLMLAMGFRSVVSLLEGVTTLAIGKSGDYGKIRTAGSVSFILMMLFLQTTPVLRPNTPFHIAIWISLTTMLTLISMIFIPSRYTTIGNQGARTGTYKTGRPDIPGNRGIWSTLLILGLIIIALSRLAMAPVNSFFSLFLVESMQWNAIGFMWALATLTEVPFMFLSKRLIARFGSLRILAITTGAVSLRLSLYALFPMKGGIIFAQCLHSLCYGLFHPAAVTFISSCVPPERRALGMSLYLSLGTGLPTLLGNILGGFIVEHFGYRVLFGSFAVFPVIAIVLYGCISIHQYKGG